MPIYTFSSLVDPSPQIDFRSDVEKSSPLLQQHDPGSPDIATAQRVAREWINVAGAFVNVFTRTDNYDVDEVYDADFDPTYWNKFEIKAFFVPKPLELELTKWGVDASSKTKVIFCKQELQERVGDRLMRPYDVIRIPYNSTILGPKHFLVKHAREAGNYRYTWLYVECEVDILAADIAVKPEPDGQPVGDDDNL